MRKYKYTAETLTQALDNLISEDYKLRRSGIRFIEYASRCELFGSIGDTIKIREWMLSPLNFDTLIKLFDSEEDIKIKKNILEALSNFYLRYINNPIVAERIPMNEDEKYTVKEFEENIRDLALQNFASLDNYIKERCAYILAIQGDSIAWDIYNKVLQSKCDYPIASRIQIVIKQYKNGWIPNKTMSEKQKAALIDSAIKLINKNNNKRIIPLMNDILVDLVSEI